MLNYPNIDPVLLSIGALKIRWYGLMYLVGIFTGWLLGCYRLKNSKNLDININKEEFTDLILYIAFGLLIGGRLGYILFYQTAVLMTKPWQILMLWQGGMSFHGGLLGAVLAMYIFCRKFNQKFFVVTDFIAPLVPPALFFGRIGNFINGELWGKVTDVPWAMVFPYAGPLPRHPSQLYEAILEGIVLFVVLWFFSRNKKPIMAVSGLFCVLYSLFRFFVEFYRLPDQQLGYLAFDWLTMGQLLSIPMLIFGVTLLFLAYKKKLKNNSREKLCVNT